MEEANSIRHGNGRALPVLGMSLLVAACSSGGNGGSGTAGIDRGGVQSPAIAVGRITGFGSVVVNGVRWDTGAAQFVVDDAAASESALAVGQVVRIEGTRASATDGSATRVEADDLAKGAIESIDSAAGELTVIGQTILVDDSTRFDPDIVLGSIDGLSAGQFIEVSGFLGLGGVVTATYIELDDDDDDSELTGYVTNLDTGALTFEINGITVDYSAAGRIDLPGGMPTEGRLIEAEGVYDATSRVLTAASLDDEDIFDGDERDDDFEVDIEGIVTRFAGAEDFDVAGIPATTTASTELEDGTIADLAAGVRIEIEGRFNTAGVLVASEIEFESDDADDNGGSGSGDDYECPPSAASGVSIESDVNVSGVCVLDGVTVGGRILVQPGAELTLVDSTVANGLQSLSARSIDVENTSFGLNIQITETTQSVRLLDVATPDNIQLEKNLGQIRIERFSAGHDFELKESVADVFVSGEAGQNAQLLDNQGGSMIVDVTVVQDAQVKENAYAGSSDVQLTGGDQAQCLDNSFEAYATGFTSVDGCTIQ